MDSNVMLERGVELAALAAAVDRVTAGGSAFLEIYGPAGVGKTRLLEHTRRLAAETGLRVLSGRGSELEREYAFGLVRQMFEPLLAAASSDERAEWLAGAAGPADALFTAGASEPLPGEFAALHGLFWLIANLVQSGPVAVLLDDLHWADEPSLRFLAYILPRLEELSLLLVIASRPAGSGTSSHLLNMISTDPECELLRPSPLSAAAAPDLVADVLGQTPEPAFADACHRATGGNPLLLGELTKALRTEHIAPTATNAPAVLQIGSHAATTRVALQLAQLDPEYVRVAEAIAVLGVDADPRNVARLAQLAVDEAAKGVAELESAELIRRSAVDDFSAPYEFVHPVVQAAVYERIPTARRGGYHAQAAQLLTEASARAEQIAAHLLRLTPAAEPDTVTTLRRAAREALTRGAPESALTYLRRALVEPPDRDDRRTILAEAGLAAARVDLPAAIEFLTAALTEADDPVAQGQIAGVLGPILLNPSRVKDALDVLTHAIGQLPPDEDDLRRALEATLLIIPVTAVGFSTILERLPKLRQLPPADTLGAAMLDGVVAVQDAYAGDPGTLDRARRAVFNPAMRKAAGEGSPLPVVGCWALAVGDPDEGIAACDELIAETRSTGSLATLLMCQMYRSTSWLRRGDLSEADADLRESARLEEITGSALARPIISAFLAEVLIEQGHLGEAEIIIERAAVPNVLPDVGTFFFFLLAKSLVLRTQGHHEQALQAALAAGDRFAQHGGQNPAMVAWRSEAAMCLHALGDDPAARKFAAEEVALARRWGAPYALGRALRVAGLLAPSPTGLGLLQDAVKVLQPSTARLEQAKALIDLGAALRRGNARVESRPYLAHGLELAYRCGATPLVERARAELRAAGARPRRLELTGPDSLTPSESRVATLAANNLTNRQIAQQLFVTTKTVEVHLSAAYRKLGINRRHDLSGKLNQQTRPDPIR